MDYEDSIKKLLRMFEETIQQRVDLSSAYNSGMLIFEEWYQQFKVVGYSNSNESTLKRSSPSPEKFNHKA